MLAANPGDYEIKVLRDGRLARSIEFSAGADGKIVNSGGGAANSLLTTRALVPVTIIGDQDGRCDRGARKSEAFYGNPPTGFTAPPQ